MTPAEGDGHSTRGGANLSAHERELLASLERRARQDDPALEARLRGHRLLRLPTWRPRPLPVWAAVLALVVGLFVTLLAAATVVWVGIVGVALVVLGGYRLAAALVHRYQSSSPEGGAGGAAGA